MIPFALLVASLAIAFDLAFPAACALGEDCHLQNLYGPGSTGPYGVEVPSIPCRTSRPHAGPAAPGGLPAGRHEGTATLLRGGVEIDSMAITDRMAGG